MCGHLAANLSSSLIFNCRVSSVHEGLNSKEILRKLTISLAVHLAKSIRMKLFVHSWTRSQFRWWCLPSTVFAVWRRFCYKVAFLPRLQAFSPLVLLLLHRTLYGRFGQFLHRPRRKWLLISSTDLAVAHVNIPSHFADTLVGGTYFVLKTLFKSSDCCSGREKRWYFMRIRRETGTRHESKFLSISHSAAGQSGTALLIRFAWVFLLLKNA